MRLARAVVDRITEPHQVYSHRRRLGDLIVFDNRACLHTPTAYAFHDYPRTRRLLHQVIVGARD